MLVALIASSLLAAPSALAAGAERHSFRIPVGGSPAVLVENVYGTISVEAGDEGEVIVDGALSGDNQGARGRWRIEAGSAAGAVRVRAVCDDASSEDGMEWCGYVRADLILRVPAQSRLFVLAVQSDVQVSGLAGAQEIETAGGNVQISSARAAVRASTISGDVRIDGAAAAVVETHSGDVQVAGVAGRVRISARSGHAEVSASRGAPRLEQRRVARAR